jgi:hypothetical protein
MEISCEILLMHERGIGTSCSHSSLLRLLLFCTIYSEILMTLSSAAKRHKPLRFGPESEGHIRATSSINPSYIELSKSMSLLP